MADNKAEKNKAENNINVVSASEMELGELSYFGMIVEIKGKEFLKLDREKFKLIKLGNKEEKVKTDKGEAIYIARRWGIIVPKGKEKEFVNVVKDKWILPDELSDYL